MPKLLKRSQSMKSEILSFETFISELGFPKKQLLFN